MITAFGNHQRWTTTGGTGLSSQRVIASGPDGTDPVRLH